MGHPASQPAFGLTGVFVDAPRLLILKQGAAMEDEQQKLGHQLDRLLVDEQGDQPDEADSFFDDERDEESPCEGSLSLTQAVVSLLVAWLVLFPPLLWFLFSESKTRRAQEGTAREAQKKAQAWWGSFPEELRRFTPQQLYACRAAVALNTRPARRPGKVFVTSFQHERRTLSWLGDTTMASEDWAVLSRKYLPQELVPELPEEVTHIVVVDMPDERKCRAWVIDWRARQLIAERLWRADTRREENLFDIPAPGGGFSEGDGTREVVTNLPKPHMVFEWFLTLPVVAAP